MRQKVNVVTLAPSLTAADVSIGMGARGSDAALEQADVILMHDKIENVENEEQKEAEAEHGDATRAQRLAQVAPVGVGQADVDDEPVGWLLGLRHRRGRIADRDDLEALLPQPARQHQAQLGVVLDDEQSEDRHVDTSMALNP